MASDLAERYRDLCASLYERHRMAEPGYVIARGFSDFFDREIKELFSRLPESLRDSIGLAATGSYGRMEMSPHSDVDLLFIVDGAADEDVKEVIGAVCYPFWDFGIDLSHSTRGIEQGVDLAFEDPTVLTSLLDLRSLAGHEINAKMQRRLWDRLREANVSPELPRKSRALKGYPVDTVHVLEPDLKDAPGGLRDFHLALWAGQIAFHSKSLSELEAADVISGSQRVIVHSAVDYLLRIRHDLHFLKGRAQDNLAVEDQIDVAKRLGYEGAPDPDLAAALLQDYHAAATEILRFSRRVIDAAAKRHHGADVNEERDIGYGFVWCDKTILLRDMNTELTPETVMRAAMLACEHQAPFAGRLERKIRSYARRIDEWIVKDGAVREMFRSMLYSEHAYTGLRSLHDAGFLGVLLPEFGRVAGFLPYDLNHRFTVDEHSLLAVYFLEALPQDTAMQNTPVQSIYERFGRKDLVKLTMLCHDLGRAAGPGHPERAARMMPLICHRFGYSEHETWMAALLVRHHGLLSRLSQLRDIEDDKTVQELVTAVKNAEVLDALYLVTYADTVAVGPGAWTSWRSDLLLRLYRRARASFAPEDNGIDAKEQIRSRVEVMLDDSSEIAFLNSYLEQAPEGYLMTDVAERLALHVQLAVALPSGGLKAGILPRPGNTYEFAVATEDRPGLFTAIACVMTSLNLNILMAGAFSMKEGIAIDNFLVEPEHPSIVVDDSVREEFEKRLTILSAENKGFQAMLKKRKRFFLPGKAKAAGALVASQVEVFDDASDDFTVVEVTGSDRPGLLFELSRVIYEEGLNLAFAKILTETHRVVDAFYVNDSRLGKIKDRRRIDRLKARLLATVSKSGLDD